MLDGHYQRWFRCLSLSLVICVTSVDSTACMLHGHYQRWFRCLSLSLVICVTSVDSTACMLDGHYQRWFRCLSLSLVICVTSVEHCWFSVFVMGLMFELCEVFLFCFFSHCFYFYGLILFLSLWTDFRKGFCERFWSVCLLMTKFDYPEVTQCSWQKISI